MALLIIAAAACHNPNPREKQMMDSIDSLQKKLDHSYKPGLGEFMNSIQLHHAKLWFAGKATNWDLAAFELDEIKELIEDIQKYNTDRDEVKSIPILKPALDSVEHTILRKDLPAFISGYSLMTNLCNDCHKATHHEFNKIIVPQTPPVTNQDFGGTR